MVTGGRSEGVHIRCAQDQNSPTDAGRAGGSRWPRKLHACRSVGKGSIAFADGHLICRGEGGAVALVEAKAEAYKEKGRFTPPTTNGNKCWAHPAISGGKLYLREQDVLYCYDLKGK